MQNALLANHRQVNEGRRSIHKTIRTPCFDSNRHRASHIMNEQFFIALLILSAGTPANADGDDDTNNLFSDIAPYVYRPNSIVLRLTGT